MTVSSTDYVLTKDKSFKKWTKAYADDQELWFKESVPIPVIFTLWLFLMIKFLVSPTLYLVFSSWVFLLSNLLPPNLGS